MNKVSNILPKAVRFHDSRVAREDTAVWLRSPRYTAMRKKATKPLAPYFAAVRKDARFAAPRLATAIRKATATEVDANANSRLLYLPLERHIRHMYWDARWARLPGLEFWQSESTSAHLALSDPSKVACYPTRADAARRREVVMGAGKFFYAVLEPSPPHVVQKATEQFLALQKPMTVFFVDNDAPNIQEDELEEGWVMGYSNPRGFSSCMSGFSDGWKHPARFYAYPGNGLSLAYMTHDNTRFGEVVARSICNKEKGTYVRVYGDGRLARALENQFGLECHAEATLDNVKCRAREANGRLLAPYLDGGMSIEWNGNTDFCTVVGYGGDYTAQNTDGFAEDENSSCCDDCGERCSEDDVAYSEYHERSICSGCRDRNYTYAYTSVHNEDWIEDDQVIKVDGTPYLNEAEVLSAHGYVFSDYDEKYIHMDDAVYLEYLDDYVDADNVVELDISYGADKYALSDDTKEIALDGETLIVHITYDGPEDDEEEDEGAVSAPENIAALAA